MFKGKHFSLGEIATVFIVANAMKIKTKTGIGLKFSKLGTVPEKSIKLSKSF